MKLELITQPSTPVSLSDAKSFYRIIGTEHDTDVQLTIDAAVDMAEKITNRQIGVATYALSLESYAPDVTLPKPPMRTVQSVRYARRDGTTGEIGYKVKERNGVSVLLLDPAPSDMDASATYQVTITYECGYDVLPPAIKSWVLIYGATQFENREQMVIGTIVSTKPKTYQDHLLDSYRVMPI